VAPTAQSLHPSPPAALQEPLAQLPQLDEVPPGPLARSVQPDAVQPARPAQPQLVQEDAVRQRSVPAEPPVSVQKEEARPLAPEMC
jgi:hypothetical protein